MSTQWQQHQRSPLKLKTLKVHTSCLGKLWDIWCIQVCIYEFGNCNYDIRSIQIILFGARCTFSASNSTSIKSWIEGMCIKFDFIEFKKKSCCKLNYIFNHNRAIQWHFARILRLKGGVTKKSLKTTALMLILNAI